MFKQWHPPNSLWMYYDDDTGIFLGKAWLNQDNGTYGAWVPWKTASFLSLDEAKVWVEQNVPYPEEDVVKFPLANPPVPISPLVEASIHSA